MKKINTIIMLTLVVLGVLFTGCNNANNYISDNENLGTNSNNQVNDNIQTNEDVAINELATDDNNDVEIGELI